MTPQIVGRHGDAPGQEEVDRSSVSAGMLSETVDQHEHGPGGLCVMQGDLQATGTGNREKTLAHVRHTIAADEPMTRDHRDRGDPGPGPAGELVVVVTNGAAGGPRYRIAPGAYPAASG